MKSFILQHQIAFKRAGFILLTVLAFTVTMGGMKRTAMRQQPSIWEEVELRVFDLNQAQAGLLSPEMVADLLIRAIIEIESAGNPQAVGEAGERGLMQIMPGTWDDMTRLTFGTPLSFDRAFDPVLNERIGRIYLAYIQTRIQSKRDVWRADERSLLLASYNGGFGRLERAGFNLSALPESVQDYVRRGTALHDQYLAEQAEQVHQMLFSDQEPPGSDS